MHAKADTLPTLITTAELKGTLHNHSTYSDGAHTLKEMADRGVRVRLLTNSLQSNNHISAHSGYLKYRKDILRTGAELYELRADAALREHFEANDKNHEVPAGIHTKSFVLDENQALIGSFNFDPRSRDLNSEIGLVIDTPGIATAMANWFDNELRQNAFKLELKEASNGTSRIQWHGIGEEGSVVWDREPHTSLIQRVGVNLLRLLPIDSQL